MFSESCTVLTLYVFYSEVNSLECIVLFNVHCLPLSPSQANCDHTETFINITQHCPIMLQGIYKLYRQAVAKAVLQTDVGTI